MATFDLTTAAKVKELLGISDSVLDAEIASLITASSAEAEKFLGRHVKDESRTEVYRQPQFRKILLVRGFPVTTLTSVKYASNRDFTSIDALTEDTDFTIDEGSGLIEFGFSTSYRPGFVEVQYEGGMSDTTNNFITAFPDVSTAVAWDVVNRLKRRGNPGGDITHNAGSLTFKSEMTRAKVLREALGPHMRRAI